MTWNKMISSPYLAICLYWSKTGNIAEKFYQTRFRHEQCDLKKQQSNLNAKL